MGDIVFHDMPHKERGEVDADDGKYQIEPVIGVVGKPCGEQDLYLLDEPVQDEGRNRSKESDKEGKDECKLLVGDMSDPPIIYLAEESTSLFDV